MHIITTRASNSKSRLNKGWLNEGNVKENLRLIIIQGKAKKCI